MNVPEGSMKVSDDSVLYEFCVVPQHIRWSCWR